MTLPELVALGRRNLFNNLEQLPPALFRRSLGEGELREAECSMKSASAGTLPRNEAGEIKKAGSTYSVNPYFKEQLIDSYKTSISHMIYFVKSR